MFGNATIVGAAAFGRWYDKTTNATTLLRGRENDVNAPGALAAMGPQLRRISPGDE